jgi:hypothetical protein
MKDGMKENNHYKNINVFNNDVDDDNYARLEMEISLRSLMKFALIVSDRVNETVSLFLLLDSVPAISKINTKLNEFLDIEREVKSRITTSSAAYYGLQNDLLNLVQHYGIKFTFKLFAWRDVVHLASKLTVPVFHCRIKMLQDAGKLSNMDCDRMLWLYSALVEKRSFLISNASKHQLLQQLFEECTKNEQYYKITNINNFLEELPYFFLNATTPWLNLIETFKRLLSSSMKVSTSTTSQVSDLKSIGDVAVEKNIKSNGYCVVKRIAVTPSRTILLQNISMKSSRLLRRFGDEYEIVVVTFTDERLQQLNDTDSFDNVYSIVENGFV